MYDEHRVGVDERHPAPHEHVVVALADQLGELAVVVDLLRGRDPDVLQPAGDELGGRLRRRALRAHGVADLQRLAAAGHLAHPVAVGVLVAALVEQRVGLVEVELELLVVGHLRHPRRVRRRGDRVGRGRVAALDAVDDRLLVDRVGDRLAHERVASAGWPFFRPSPPLIANSWNAPWLPSTTSIPSSSSSRSYAAPVTAVRGVDLTAAQRRDHRVRVVEVADHDRGERRLAAPVVRVGLEARELALLELGQRVGARADAVLPVVLERAPSRRTSRRCASGRCRRPCTGSFGSGTDDLTTTVVGSVAFAVRFAVIELWLSHSSSRERLIV